MHEVLFRNGRAAGEVANGGVLSGQGLALVSVVVPIYNVERYLAECLDSLVRQTDPAFEVVLIDDGSTDGSSGIAAEYCASHPNFRMHRQKNTGLGGARNAGVDMCDGEWVTFVDSDDLVSDDYVALLRAEQERDGLDVVTAGFNRISDDGQVLPEKAPAPQYTLPRNVELSDAERVLGLFAPSIACARLYRKDLLKANGLRFPDRMPHEDWYFTYKALMLSGSNGHIENKIYHYRQRAGTLSRALTVGHVDTLVEQWRDTRRFLARVDGSARHWTLAARRTLLAIGAMHNRSSHASDEVKVYLAGSIARHRDQFLELLDVVNGSEIRECWLPETLRKLIGESMPADAILTASR